MAYRVDPASRSRALLTYAAVICVSAVVGVLVRLGVITDHMLW